MGRLKPAIEPPPRGAAMTDNRTEPRPEDEVVRICQELIRIDTSNYGDGSGPGERAAAEYTAGLMAEVGLDAEIFEAAPGRASVVTRLAGEDPSASALVVHGHLDVVPALREQWSVDPFGAELKDGMIWGRGAVDMKDMDAMILSVLREFRPHGPQAQAGPHLRVLRRRGSRRHLRRPLRRREAARTLRGRHRGDLRGRRLLRHHRRPAHLPAPDRREGPLLAPPRRPRPRRATAPRSTPTTP